jgi:hypothetical protein
MQKRYALQSLGLAAALRRTVRLTIDLRGAFITTSAVVAARAFRVRCTVM